MSSLRVCLTLLLSLLATTLSCGAAPPPPPVYDTEGNELSTNASYYVLPPDHGHGGGLTLAPHRFYRCPLFVSQEASESRPGFPVQFTPLGGAASTAGDLTVRLSTDVRIYFDAKTTCVQTTEWHVDNGELLSGRRHVVTGPVTNPREIAFRIEKYSGAEVHEYKLMSCQDKCEDLGMFRDNKGGAWFLGVTEPVHVVVFKKASSTF